MSFLSSKKQKFISFSFVLAILLSVAVFLPNAHAQLIGSGINTFYQSPLLNSFQSPFFSPWQNPIINPLG